MAGALSPAEIADALGLGSQAFSTRHWSIVACSAVTGEGLVQGVDWVVDDVNARVLVAD